jgi:hypothetical protein
MLTHDTIYDTPDTLDTEKMWTRVRVCVLVR